MITDIMIPAKLNHCDVCAYEWVSTRKKKPEACQNRECRSREWDGKSKPIYSKEITLPAPRKPGRPKSIALLDDREGI